MNIEKTFDKDKKFNIILATQSATLRSNLAIALRMQGYTVELVQGGFHLLHLLENSQTPKIDLVIINGELEDMPGFEVVSLIRTTKDKTELPILFVCKQDSEEAINDMISIGANDYIVQTSAMGSVINAAKKYCC